MSDDASGQIVPDATVRAEAARRLDVARAAAAAVGDLALQFYQSPELEPTRKEDGSEVTHVDRDGETLVRQRIADAYGSDSVLGEEHGQTDGSSEWRWVIDPIDGTRSFVHGVPTFCTLIGIEHEGVPVAGLATWPALGERLEAVCGGGARWITRSGVEREGRVSACTRVDQATIQLGAPTSFARRGRGAWHPQYAAAVRRIRGWDDGFAFGLIATGRMDAGVQCGLSRWDLAAFVPILAEAGGTLVAWDGRDPLEPPGCIVAGPPDLVHGLVAIAATGDVGMHHAD